MRVLDRIANAYRSLGLVKRMAIISVGMLFLIQLAVQFVIRSSIEDSVKVNVQGEMEASINVWSRLVDQNSQKLQLCASVLASDYGFRSAVGSGDMQTIGSALENSGNRIGATVVGLIGTDLAIKELVAPGEDKGLRKTVEGLVRIMANDQQGGRMTIAMGRLHQFVMVPVKAPLTIGWVVMGFPVDESLSKDIGALTGAQVLIGRKLPDGTLQRVDQGQKNYQNFAPPEVDETGQDWIYGGEEFFVRMVKQKGLADHLQIYLLHSPERTRQVFAYTKSALIVIDIIGLIIFALGTMAAVQKVSKPLKALLFSVQRLGGGDYSQKIDDFGQKDEVGELAASFDEMRKNIKASQVEIRQLAYWDRLTGLPNREQMRETLQWMISAQPSQYGSVTVLVLDIDRLKHINDVLGYSFGDKVLQAVGQRLQAISDEEQGAVARMGGGQFALVLGGIDIEVVHKVAARISSALELPVVFDGQMVDLRAGMGISCWPEHTDDVDVLLGNAEVAMYVAKRKSVPLQIYNQTLDSGSALTLSMLSELRKAIDQRELRLFLQPKIDLATHTVVAAEALVRWQHPTRGMVPPMEFIPFAEQTGFVRHLTLWIMEEVAAQWHSLQPLDGSMRIAINLSTRDLMDQEFPDKIGKLLSTYNAPLEGFCLEITESAIMDDPIRAEATLNQLADSGYKLSIDDFGTGYSSLAYLKRLPVTEIKIDKSFVMGMEANESDAQIVRSTIDLAHNLGLTVVAEGVENAAVYKLLGDLRCDEGQGYYMNKPIPCHLFNEWRQCWIAKDQEGAPA